MLMRSTLCTYLVAATLCYVMPISFLVGCLGCPACLFCASSRLLRWRPASLSFFGFAPCFFFRRLSSVCTLTDRRARTPRQTVCGRTGGRVAFRGRAPLGMGWRDGREKVVQVTLAGACGAWPPVWQARDTQGQTEWCSWVCVIARELS